MTFAPPILLSLSLPFSAFLIEIHFDAMSFGSVLNGLAPKGTTDSFDPLSDSMLFETSTPRPQTMGLMK